MKRALLLPLLVCLGCQQPQLVQVDLPNAYLARPSHERVGPHRDWLPTWGATEYAPGQYAGVAWDETGVYCNLNGQEPTWAVVIGVNAEHDGRGTRRELWFTSQELLSAGAVDWSFPSLARRPPAPPGVLTEDFEWVGPRLITKLPFAYGATFWLSWKALGLDGPPQGRLSMAVWGLQRQPPGAVLSAPVPAAGE